MLTKRAILLHWLDNEIISRGDVGEALKAADILPGRRDWQIFLDRLMLFCGVLALAFAVIFFFAYNWEDMGRFAQFATIEILLVASLIGYWQVGAQRFAGKIVLTASALLLGGLLALFGQTYQSGADPWQLFAGWAIIILPWVVCACFAPLWLLWIGLVNIAIYLYFSVFPDFWGLLFAMEAMLFCGFLFNFAAQILCELAAKHFVWLQYRWAVRLVGVLCGLAVSVWILQTILDWSDASGWAVAVYPLWLVTIYLLYRYGVDDLFMLAGMCLSLIFVITGLLIRILDDLSSAGGLLLIAMVVITLSGLAAAWLKRLHGEFAE